MSQTISLRRVFHRFFPKKARLAFTFDSKSWDHLNFDQKKDLALQVQLQGEFALLQGNLSALSLFESASLLSPNDPSIIYRQGLAFFEYGSEDGKEKALLLAAKYFKMATQFNDLFFDAWVAWGNVLLQLGRFHEEHHFLLEARDKYKKALEIHAKHPQPNEIVGELYWDSGIVWMELANYSGEAVDYHLAVQAFQTSLDYYPNPVAEFWNDFGNAYLQLGLLINDPRYFLQAVKYLQKSILDSPNYFDGWFSLAETYSQLYLTTLDERYSSKASDCYTRSVVISPKDSVTWLAWAQLLGELGKNNKNTKTLLSSIEKCARSFAIESNNTEAMAQWVESLSWLGIYSNRLDLIIEAERKIIKATDQYPDDFDLWYSYGICQMAFARYFEDADYIDLAIEKLQFGLSLDRTNAEIWHALGFANKYLAELTDEEVMVERAVRFLSKAMELKTGCPALIFDTACAYLHYSEALDNLEALETSLSLFESLLQNHRTVLLNHPEWLFQYGCALDWLGEYTSEEKDFARAIETFSHILLIDPDFPKIHLQMAQTYVQMGHAGLETEYYKRALYHFKLSQYQDDENETLWLEWGLCLINLAHHTIDSDLMEELYVDAEQKLIQAGILGNAMAHYHLACLYSILGRTQEAMEFWKMIGLTI